MKIKVLGFLLSGCFLLGLSACYYDVEEELYGSTTATCDTVSVSYASEVVPILEAKCYSCHAGDALAGGGIKLGTYPDLKSRIDNFKSRFISSIVQDGTVSAMPQGQPKMADCSINKIVAWVHQGYPQN
jgi:hypothetical protein